MGSNIKKPRTGLLSWSAAQEQRLKEAVIQREFPDNLIALSNLSENFEQNVGNPLLIFFVTGAVQAGKRSWKPVRRTLKSHLDKKAHR
jgi:hypothetical protein